MKTLMKLLCLILICLSLEWPASAASDQARPTAARADIDGELTTGLETFRRDCGRYPTTTEGWAALTQCPTNIPAKRWHGPYLQQIPVDPWGRVYVYASPGLHHPNGFDLYSCGPDPTSKSKGSGPDDINNWDPDCPHLGLGYTLRNLELPGLIFMGLGVLVIGLVRWTGRPGQAGAARLPATNQMGQLLAVIWQALGLGLFFQQAVHRHVDLPFNLLWWVIIGVWGVGLVRTIDRFMSGSPTRIFAGSVLVYEIVFILWWLAMPRMA
jgi:general secretion pathway protein G